MTRPRSRRALLWSGAAALGGLAGCVGGQDDEPGTAAPSATTATTDERSGTGTPDSTAASRRTETTDQRAVELVPTSVQTSFFYRRTPGSLDVGAVEGRQFAFVNVGPRTDSPPPSDFALIADNHHFWGSLAPGEVGGPNRLVERGPGYQYEEARPGWVAFEVPNPLDVEAVVLAHDGRKRPVGEEFLAALRAPPADFELLGIDTPDRVAPDESFEVSATVQNAGDASGTFRACLDVAESTRPPRRTAFAIPAGEQREWVRTLDTPSASHDSIDVRFRSAATDRVTTVAVDSGTTDEGSPN